MKDGGGRTGTVLVVDDDAALRMLCRINLELDGYHVLEAATVDEAAAHATASAVDLVLLDVRMDEGREGGLALLDRLPGGGERPAVALLTGSVDVARFSEPEGVDAVIIKPFALDELLNVVRRLIEPG